MNEVGKIKIIRGLSSRERWSRIAFLATALIFLTIGAICLINAIKWIDRPFPGFLVNQRLVAGGVGQYNWTGTKAGLKFPDKILKADDRTVTSVSDLEEVINNTDVGTPIKYSVERGDQKIELTVATMRFSLADFSVIAGTYLFVSVVYLLIGVVVFIMKPDTKVSWIFLLSCFFLSIYYILIFDLVTHHAFVRFFLFVNIFFPAVGIHFSMVFPVQKKFIQRYPYLQFIPYIISLIMTFFIEIYYPGPMFVRLHNFTYIYMLIAAIALLVSIFNSYFRETSTLARQRAKVVLFGVALAFPLPAIATIMLVRGMTLFGVQIQSNFLSIPMLIFPASIAYAITRHNLFDVDVFIKRTIGYIIMTVVLGSVFLLMHVLADIVVHHQLVGGHAPVHHELAEGDASVDHELVKGTASEHHGLAAGDAPAHHELVKGTSSEHHGPAKGGAHVQSLWSKLNIGDKILPVLSALLIVFFFNPFHHSIQHLVDKLFYRKKYDYKKTITSVSHKLNSMLNEDSIIKQLILTVRKEMFVDTAGVILLEPQTKSLQTLFMDDETDKVKDHIKEVHIAYDDPLLALLSKEKKMITKYDIAEDPHYSYVKEACGNRFLEMESSLAIPLIYKDQVKGVFSIGHKKSGHFYTREDIDLLRTLANHGIVAIENAKFVEQIKKEESVRLNLSRYLSPQITEQVVNHEMEVNLGGDRKVVTVLFSDIRDFTTITETRPPDQLVNVLNDYFTEMARVIFENKGSLDKFIGDAIVAVFGSLISLENPAQNAVNAASEMMKRLPVLNEEWKKKYDFTLEIGIGVTTGEVFLGNVGSPERMEFTVIGDAVNVASRFSGLAKAGQVLITRETLNSLGSGMKYIEHPPSAVKGKTGKLEVFEITY